MKNLKLAFFVFLLTIYFVSAEYSPFTNKKCDSSRECYPHGECVENYCECNQCYENDNLSNELCGVKLVPIIAGFLISFFLGACGIDHCFMSGCTCPGVAIGIVKALTLGGLGFWWLCDVIFMGTGTFNERYNLPNYQLLCDEWTT